MHSLPNEFSTDIHSPGNAVELIEFVDFACTRCRSIRQLLHTVFDTFNGQLTYSFHYFPNRRSEASTLAALAAEAARRQGYFWPMFQALFTQPTINRTTLSILAIYLGMNYNQFIEDLEDDELRLCIEADQEESHRLGVTKTPTLFVGGQQFHGRLTPSRLIPIVRAHLSRSNRPILTKVDATSGTIYWGKGE
jgi:protein-disulfide isomerase